MLLRRIYNDQLAQASYLVGCAATGEALVVDPNRDIGQYITLAEREGLRITAVTETHIHADFVSGARELAHQTHARLYLSDMGDANWKYAYAADAGATMLYDGSSFRIGNILIEALHTPGHTPEHLSYLITDTAGADQPIGILTGDFVFVGDVGRPDLLEKAAGLAGTSEQAARDLFHSLQRFKQLPDYLQVWPGHGAGSACGRGLGAMPQTTVGYERRFNWAFGIEDAAHFVEAVLSGQPAAPPYFADMKRVNKRGPFMLSEPLVLPKLRLDDLVSRVNEGDRVVDLRSAGQYAAGHIRGAINIPMNNAFLNWAGWMLRSDHPFILIGDQEQSHTAASMLRLIGLDTVSGFCDSGIIDEWQRHGYRQGTIERRTPEQARTMIEHRSVIVIDVRNPEEYNTGHIIGSHNIPLAELSRRMHEIPMDRMVLVHCQAGARSSLGASLIDARGRNHVIELIGGFSSWQTLQNHVDRTPQQQRMMAS